MKHFYDLRTVDDLADGEIATPEPGITYDLRTINNRKLDVGSVVDVIRQGPTLFARTTSGDSIAVSATALPSWYRTTCRHARSTERIPPIAPRLHRVGVFLVDANISTSNNTTRHVAKLRFAGAATCLEEIRKTCSHVGLMFLRFAG